MQIIGRHHIIIHITQNANISDQGRLGLDIERIGRHEPVTLNQCGTNTNERLCSAGFHAPLMWCANGASLFSNQN